MMRLTETRLRRAFADVLTAVLATAGVAACGGSTSEGGSTPTFTTMCTGANGAPGSLLSGLHASPAIDGAVMRTESAFPRSFEKTQQGGVTLSPEDVGDAWVGTSGETSGSICSKAADVPGCLAKVAGYRVLPLTREACRPLYPGPLYSEPPRDCAVSYIVYTRGDQIGVARTTEETKALIGTVDKLEEAVWIARNAGYQPSCGASGRVADSEYRTTADGGWDLRLVTPDSCGSAQSRLLVHVDFRGELTVLEKEEISGQAGCAAGRRPEGLRLGTPSPNDPNAVGRYFGEMATLETASVTAFRRLHRQLAAHGAPRELLARIRQAVRDEIRHARATTKLAKKYGVTPLAPSIAPCRETPSLFAIARENAREGCVRETYGALVAHFQVTHARDADVRSAMAAIADEETEHAALSWDVAAWIEAQLDRDERAMLAAERRAAFTVLARELSEAVDLQVRHVSGVPGVREALRMLEGLAPVMLAAA